MRVPAAQIHAALRTVGIAAWGLGVRRDPRLTWVARLSRLDACWKTPAGQIPELGYLGLLDDVEALGWTALAAWIEGGVRPIEVEQGSRAAMYHVRMCGAVAVSGFVLIGNSLENFAALARSGDPDATAIVATARQAHRDAGELALAFAVLRRWVAPTRPWGLRDSIGEHLERVGREATARAIGSRATLILDPIPPSYLAAFGTAAE